MKVDQATNIDIVKRALDRRARILSTEKNIANKKVELAGLRAQYAVPWDFAYETIYTMDEQAVAAHLDRIHGLKAMVACEREISQMSNHLLVLKQRFASDMEVLTKAQLKEDQEHDKQKKTKAGEEGDA